MALILGGALLVAWALLTGRAAGRLHGGLTLLAFAALGGLHRPLDRVVGRPRRLVAGGQPDLRLRRDVRRRARARADRARALGGGAERHLARLRGGLRVGAADQDLPRRARRRRDLRAPARALRLLERDRPDGRARRAAAAVAGRAPLRAPGRQRARLARARAAVHLHHALLLARLPAGAGARARPVVRRRAAAPARRAAAAGRRGRHRPGDRVGVRARRAHHRQRAARRARRRRPRARDAARAGLLPAAGGGPGGELRDDAELRLAAHAPAGRARAGRRAGADPRRAPARARERAGRRQRPGLRRLGEAHRPQGGDADQHPRPPARDLLGARALLARVVDDLRELAQRRGRRGRLRDRAHALPRRHPDGPPRPRLRGPDARRPRARRGRALARGDACCGSSPR